MPYRDVVVMGASAGGVQALQELVAQLPGDLKAVVFVVLHIPHYGATRLPEVLSAAGPLPAKLAEDGLRPEPGTIYIAPNDSHLLLQGQVMRLTQGPRENRVRPCIDVLFRSAAAEYGPRVIGVVLSGLLDDGTAGLFAIKDRGGIAIVQDPSTTMHADMPRNALRHVEIKYSLAPRQIAEKLAVLTREEVDMPSVQEIPDRLHLETQIAIEGNALKSGVLKIGELSPNTCPECHGVLVKIREGSIVRYRCHTGHAFSMETLLVDVDIAVDNALWDAIRAIEERALILREMRDLAQAQGMPDLALSRSHAAEEAVARAQRIRDLVVGSPSGGAKRPHK